MNEFAAAEWERAGGALAAARQLVDTDPNSSASRAYYAAFHATRALFARRGRAFTKHAAVRAAVHRDLVRTQAWSEDEGRAYEFLLDLRQTGDSGGVEHVTRSDAAEAVAKAEVIVAAVKRSCPSF